MLEFTETARKSAFNPTTKVIESVVALALANGQKNSQKNDFNNLLKFNLESKALNLSLRS